jgi:hypothetical protein
MSRVFPGLIVGVSLFAISSVGVAADNAQQERMKDCNRQATGMTGDARKTFISSCLSGSPITGAHPKCTPGKSKPCGNSCIAIDKYTISKSMAQRQYSDTDGASLIHFPRLHTPQPTARIALLSQAA